MRNRGSDKDSAKQDRGKRKKQNKKETNLLSLGYVGHIGLPQLQVNIFGFITL